MKQSLSEAIAEMDQQQVTSEASKFAHRKHDPALQQIA